MSTSEVSQLKNNLRTYSANTTKQAQNLQGSLKQYDSATREINRLIGGSSQGKEGEVDQAIREARKKVEQASQALMRAAKIARQYGDRL